jgi:hypothetical protein
VQVACHPEIPESLTCPAEQDLRSQTVDIEEPPPELGWQQDNFCGCFAFRPAVREILGCGRTATGVVKYFYTFPASVEPDAGYGDDIDGQ